MRPALIFLVLTCGALPAFSYSVQTHEELIDLAWNPTILPILKRRFPGLTPHQIKEAHAYAYGGSGIQDIGYYPFGNGFFSDLTHYVRSGDFVASLVQHAQTPNELAFAIGALAHYVGDSIGHSEAINRSVAIEFPKLAKEYGPLVSYARSPHAHVRTEFAFDVNQLSKHRFAPSGYLNYIGLEIPGRQLRDAFFGTYGLSITPLLGKRQAALRVYRFGVRRFLPAIARAETLLYRKKFPPDVPGPEFDRFAAAFRHAEAENGWDAYDRKPGLGSHIIAFLIFIVPKIGPLSMLSLRGPQVRTEPLYVKSVMDSLAALDDQLEHLHDISRTLPNLDLDTGRKVAPGGYPLTDQTYARLLAEIVKNTKQPIPAEVKQDLTDYYSDPAAPIATKKDPKKWAQVQANLQVLATMPVR